MKASQGGREHDSDILMKSSSELQSNLVSTVSAEKPFELLIFHFFLFGNPATCFSLSVVYHFVLSNRVFVLQLVIFILINRLKTNSYGLNLLGGRLISC